jgi:amino acid permease
MTQSKQIDSKASSFKEVYEKDHKKTNYVETMMHLLKANVGTGCFALGAAFKYGGIILGPILLCFIAVITVHAQHMLIKCADFLKRARYPTQRQSKDVS